MSVFTETQERVFIVQHNVCKEDQEGVKDCEKSCQVEVYVDIQQKVLIVAQERLSGMRIHRIYKGSLYFRHKG